MDKKEEMIWVKVFSSEPLSGYVVGGDMYKKETGEACYFKDRLIWEVSSDERLSNDLSDLDKENIWLSVLNEIKNQ